MSEWINTTLGTVLNFRRGHDLPKNNMINGDIPVAGSNGVIGWHNEATNISPCLTIGRSGSVGKPYYYEKAWAHNTVLYVDDFKDNDPKFLYYLIQTLPLAEFQAGSAVPTLNRNHIHPIQIKFPSTLILQKKIAAILSSLDDKIETNRAINARLEELAAAIFKSWFIDFEPFADGEFIEDEHGRRPKGWKVVKLEDIIEVKYGKDHKKIDVGDIPIYGSGGIMRYGNRAIQQTESVLIPRKGSLNNIIYVDNPFWTVDTMFYTTAKRENILKWLYFSIKDIDFTSMNSGSAIPSMTTKILNGLNFTLPDNESLKSFEKIISPIFSNVDINLKENARLASLRDTLLPRLMSGEIKPE